VSDAASVDLRLTEISCALIDLEEDKAARAVIFRLLAEVERKGQHS
jgi:hypothetical protein